MTSSSGSLARTLATAVKPLEIQDTFYSGF
jgi:hypothetical protein